MSSYARPPWPHERAAASWWGSMRDAELEALMVRSFRDEGAPMVARCRALDGPADPGPRGARDARRRAAPRRAADVSHPAGAPAAAARGPGHRGAPARAARPARRPDRAPPRA